MVGLRSGTEWMAIRDPKIISSVKYSSGAKNQRVGTYLDFSV